MNKVLNRNNWINKLRKRLAYFIMPSKDFSNSQIVGNVKTLSVSHYSKNKFVSYEEHYRNVLKSIVQLTESGNVIYSVRISNSRGTNKSTIRYVSKKFLK